MSALVQTGDRDIDTVRFPDQEPPTAVDVLVVGAGPVGLSAAVELEGRGVDVAVVDRATHATLVRAGAMGHTARVVEHFRRWGVLQRIRDGWTVPPEWNRGIRLVTSLAGHELVPTPPPTFTGAVVPPQPSAAEAIRRPQAVLQQAFLDQLRERGVTVAGGWEVRGLVDHADWVEVQLVRVGSRERRTVRAGYVVAADGGSSTVRRLAGIQRTGEHATDKRLRLIVRTGDLTGQVGPAPSATNIVFNAKASGFLAAVSSREWRVYAGPFPLDHAPSEEELLDTARAAFGLDLDLDLVSATTDYDASRVAVTFRRGRVLLAGDAAHVRTPGGNLGEGFGDVVNLGWKLAAVLAGHAPDALLDSYDAERRPHNWRVADHALDRARRARVTLAEIRRGGVPDDADDGAEARRRRAEIGEILGRERLASAGVTFDERYDRSAVLWYEPGQLEDEPTWQAARYQDDPRPGHRAPDGIVDPYGGTLYDRIGNAFALLVVAPHDGAQDVHAGAQEALLTAEVFVAEAKARRLPFTVVHLSDPHARQVYGVGAVLVRPDQHVAWRGTHLPPGGAAVLDRVLGGAVGVPTPLSTHDLELAGV